MKKTAEFLSSLVVCRLLSNAWSSALSSATRAKEKAIGSPEQTYQSPYSIHLAVPLAELTASDSQSPRNNAELESTTPYKEWYSDVTLKKFTAWGPRARTFPPLSNFNAASLDWKQQRLIAVATKYINLPYQHHHIPAWDPPKDWPWKAVPSGENSRGLDCSNFTSWVYNYGLGITFTSDVHRQADLTQVKSADGKGTIVFKQIPGDTEYGALVKMLRAGDLVFVRHKDEPNVVSHVVMWLGQYARSPDGTPLIIDCTAQDNQDCNGTAIPTGVQIRAFTPESWYYKRFHHASRILLDKHSSGGAKG
jgi:cell wall-associated NlpC family hydrolase